MKIYTVGYLKKPWTPESLQEAAKHLDAIVVDLRIRPYSARAEWYGYKLRKLMDYVHIPTWGPKAGAPLGEVKDYQEGLEVFMRAFKGHDNAILLCGCRDLGKCHRKQLAECFQATLTDPKIIHLDGKAENQLELL